MRAAEIIHQPSVRKYRQREAFYIIPERVKIIYHEAGAFVFFFSDAAASLSLFVATTCQRFWLETTE